MCIRQIFELKNSAFFKLPFYSELLTNEDFIHDWEMFKKGSQISLTLAQKYYSRSLACCKHNDTTCVPIFIDVAEIAISCSGLAGKMSSSPNDLINVSIRDEALKIMPRPLFNCPVEEKIKLNSACTFHQNCINWINLITMSCYNWTKTPHFQKNTLIITQQAHNVVLTSK